MYSVYMKKYLNFLLLIVTFVSLLVLLTTFYINTEKEKIPVDDSYHVKKIVVSNFQECMDAGYPVLESFPRQCKTDDGVTYIEEHVGEKCDDMSIQEAFLIAQNSKCGVKLDKKYYCNEYSKTWWIDLNVKKQGCNPACVIDVKNKSAEINWRCTGLKSDESLQ